MGLVFPTEGEARILGRPLGDPEMKQQIGYLPEQPYFYDYLTGRELLNYFGQLFGLSRRERDGAKPRAPREGRDDRGGRRAASQVLEGNDPAPGNRPGPRQSPALVFLDEPMSGLDPVGRREMSLLIRELHDSGVTVFFCSHILSDVEQLCDRVAILNRGKLVAGRSTLRDHRRLAARGGSRGRRSEPGARESDRRRRFGIFDGRARGATSPFPTCPSFEKALPVLLEGGAHLVSVNPVKETLEDHFIREVGAGERE